MDTQNTHTKIEFECWHDNGVMYNDFGNGVQIQHHFAAKKTAVIVNGEVKATYDNLSIEEFMQKQVEVAEIANNNNKGGNND